MEGAEYVDEATTPTSTPPPLQDNVTSGGTKLRWLIEIILLLITTLSTVGAVVVALIANYQTNEALELTKYQIHVSDSLMRANDSSNRIKDMEQIKYRDSMDYIQDVRTSKSISAQVQLVETQLKAIRENQTQFQISNRPFLQMGYFNISTPELNRGLKMTYQLKNLGRYPAKIFRQRVVLVPIYSPPRYDNEFLTFVKEDSVVEYLVDTLPYKIAELTLKFNKSYIEAFYSGKIFIHVISFFDFIDLVEGKRYRFKFSGRLENDGAFFISTNEIIEIR